jgi:transmembrane sensor
MADAVRLAQLIVNRIQGTITPSEEAELDEWINASPENKAFMENEIRYDELTEDMLILAEMDEIGLDETAWRIIEEALASENSLLTPATAETIPTMQHPSRRRSKGLLISALTLAAVLLFLFLRTTLVRAQTNFSPSRTAIWNSLPPATSKPAETPILTISKDLVLGLDTAQEGRMASLGNWLILKMSRQHIAYILTNNTRKAGSMADSIYNVISLPPGGTETWQITLPDGSGVFLDPGSSLSFSVHPSKKTPQRMVALNGSAFFQVSHDPQSPFILETNKDEITVTGTSFFIRDHQEDLTSTVLQYSGRLAVANEKNASAILDSAQRATIDPSLTSIEVEKNVPLPLRPSVPLEYFDFSRQDLTSALQEIAEYYRIESIHIDRDLDTRTPGKLRMGKFEKDIPLDQLLHGLEQDSLHFTATDEEITVTK